MKLTLGEARSRLRPRFSSARYSDAQLSALINKACELLITKSTPKDAIKRVAITAYGDGMRMMLTLPREYSTCIGVIRNKVPIPIRNGWIEFVQGGPGQVISDDSEIQSQIVDVGDGFCCFKEPYLVNAAGCVLKFVTDAAPGIEIPDAVIEVYGLDAAGNEIRTVGAGDARFGEVVDLNTGTGNVTTTNSFNTLSQIAKPRTRGVVSVFAINPDDATENLIGLLAPGETSPSFRRYMVPKDPQGQDAYVLVALCRQRFVEALEDNDVIGVQLMNALENAMSAINYKVANDDDRYARELAEALDLLSRESGHFKPNSQRPPMVNFVESGGVRMRAFY